MQQPPQEQSTYLLDANKATEIARLQSLDRTVTHALGGHLRGLQSEQIASLRDVLDIGCGPGDWLIGLTSKYPNMTATGIDVSPMMIDHANAMAMAQGNHAHFQIMNATKPLAFPDNSFDLVHARFIVGFMQRGMWPSLLSECYRITRPGGYISLIEGDAYVMGSDALISISTEMTAILWKLGISFAQHGQSFCVTPRLKPFVKEAGYRIVNRSSRFLDFSADEPAHESLFRNTIRFFEQFKKPIEEHSSLSLEHYEALVAQAITDMQKPDFCGIWYLLNVVGQKP